ncbi:MAG: hypothetical protein K940chlam2_01676 [Chlamydiae bacterium]|nr:hypothetical protein [Chlamydiota bacterium]
MHSTFFVAPSMPALVLGEPAEISFEEVITRLSMNLSERQMKKVEVLRRLIDIYNVRQLFLDHPIDKRGNFNEKELDEALLVEAMLPDYVFDFLGQFESNQEKARHFYGLLSRYFTEEMVQQKGFMHEYLKFQRDLKLVVTAWRAKRADRDISVELQFEDFTDPLVAHILAQKDMEKYEPPSEFEEFFRNLSSAGDDPWEQFRAVAHFEFNQIEELSGYPLFAIDWILGYVARLMIVERYAELDPERGTEILNEYKKMQDE